MMKNISTAEDLRAAIVLLESERDTEGKLLRLDLMQAYESIKPINLIKSTFKEVSQSQDVKDNLLNSGISMLVGTLTKKLVVGSSNHPMRKLVGTAIMFGVTNIISKHPGFVKSASMAIMNFVKVKLNVDEPEDSDYEDSESEENIHTDY